MNRYPYYILFVLAVVALGGLVTTNAQTSSCENPPPNKPWCTLNNTGIGGRTNPIQAVFFESDSDNPESSQACTDFCESNDCIAVRGGPECVKLDIDTEARKFSIQASGTDDPEISSQCLAVNQTCRGYNPSNNPFASVDTASETCRSTETDSEYRCDYFRANLVSIDQNFCGVDFAGKDCGRYCFSNFDNYITDQVTCRPTQLECLLAADGKDADQLGAVVCGVNNPESDVSSGDTGDQTIGSISGRGITAAFELDGFKPFQDVENLYNVEGETNTLPQFINTFLGFVIGLTGAVVVVMIVVGGFSYVTAAATSSKAKGRELISNALLGLLLLLGAVAILNTINPQLLNLQALKPIPITITQEEFDGPVGIAGRGNFVGGNVEDLYRPSADIACAAGTIDRGVHDGYYKGNKMDIRVCAIPGLEDVSPSAKFGTEIVVNSRVSEKMLAMVQAMTASGLSPTAREGFRDNDTQILLYEKYRNGTGNEAARPGHSRHQSGTAIDFNLGTAEQNIGGCKARPNSSLWVWLNTNAINYSIKQYCKESWHWSPDGK